MMKKRSTTIFVGAAILCTTTSLGLFSQYKYFHANARNGDNNKSLRTNNIIEKNQFNNNDGSNDNDNNNVNTNVNTNVPKLPILLLSGVLGGAVKQVGLKPVEYFRGIPKAMKKKGAIIFDPYTPPTSSIETRANLVSEAVERGSFSNTIATNVMRLAFDKLKAAPIVLGAPNWIAPGADMEDTYAPQIEDIFDSVFGEFFPEKRANKRGIRSWDFIQLAGQGL